MPPSSSGGLGDFAPKSANPLETYWDIVRQGVGIPKRKFIVSPTWKPCDVAKTVPPGPEQKLVQAIIAAQQEMFECHQVPRNWQLLADLFEKLQNGTFMVKNPNWHESPITGIGKDLRNDTGAAVASDTVPTAVISMTVPDRHVGSVTGFGNGLCTFADWDRVLWTVQINKRPVQGYQDFRLSIGEYDRPSVLPKPFILKYKDLYEVTARLSGPGAAAEAYCRTPAFIIPVRDVTQDGSFKSWATAV